MTFGDLAVLYPKPGRKPPCRASSQVWPAGLEPTSRFSLLREAAAVVRAGGGTGTGCQVVDLPQQPCPAKADVKLADPDGNSLWACLRHADEILLTVPTAFIANPSGAGLSGYRSRRPQTAPRHPQPS